MTTPNIEELIASFPEQNTSNFEWNAAQILNEWGIDAAAALQSQAERINELEAENGKLSDLWSAMKAKRDTLRAELNTTEVLLEECKMDWSGDVTQIMAGYDAGMADAKRMAQQGEPAQGVGRTNPGDETGGAVERFGWQTFLGKSPKIVPATNGSFVWYSDYLKLWQSAQPVHQGERAELIRRLYAIANTEANEVADALNEAADMLQSAQPEDGCAPNHMCNGHRVHIPTGECCNKCGATSW